MKYIIFFILSVSLGFSLDTDYNDLKHNKSINELFYKYEHTDDLKQKHFYLVAAAEKHSGLANLLLAQEINTPYSQKIKYYFQAAKYGYPKQAYKQIAEIYLKGVAVTKDEFLAECYNNLSKDKPNQALLVACRSRSQVLQTNSSYGSYKLQSSYEINRQANLDYKTFCNNFANSNLLNPNLDKYEQHLLMNKICHNDKANTSEYIHNGDIVYKDNQLFKKTAKGYIAYKKKVSDGLVVYKINTPISLYIAKDNELVLAQNGDQIIKNHQTYIVDNNKLVKYQV